MSEPKSTQSETEEYLAVLARTLVPVRPIPPLRVVAVLAGLGLLVERAQSAWRARARGAPTPA